MMRPLLNRPIIAAAIAVIGVVLAVTLLATKMIGEITFCGVLSLAAICAFAVVLMPRLVEVNLREMKLVLEKLERVKADIAAMYGGLETVRIEHPSDGEDRQRHDRLGAGSGFVVLSGAVVNYVTGCMRRERERLASIFITGNPPDAIAKGILDRTKDDLVFKWEPGSVPLDKPPRSMEERAKAKVVEAERHKQQQQQDKPKT